MIPGYSSFYSEGFPQEDLLDNFNGKNTAQIFYTWGPENLTGSGGKLDSKVWKFSTDGTKIFLDDEIIYEIQSGYIAEVRGTFDQLGRPQFIYKLLPEMPDTSLYSLYFFEGSIISYWYDTRTEAFVTKDNGIGRSVYAVFDVSYYPDDTGSDYMFFWVNQNNEIVFTVQREYHEIINPTGIILDRAANLIRVAMSVDYRLQIVYEKEVDGVSDWIPESEVSGDWVSE